MIRKPSSILDRDPVFEARANFADSTLMRVTDLSSQLVLESSCSRQTGLLAVSFLPS